jgi:hypothetical protein
MTEGRAFLQIAEDLELAGLIWSPEIGDEVSYRVKPEMISILVDPQGMSPDELRSTFMWLPTVEQLLWQVEARQAILFHAGLELSHTSLSYKTVIQAPPSRQVEATSSSLRASMGLAVRDLLLKASTDNLH